MAIRRRFSENEIQTIKENADKTNQELADLLQRSVHSIKQVKKLKKIYKKRITYEDVK